MRTKKRNFTSRDDKSEDSEINDFGERYQAENKNDENKGRIRKFFWNCKLSKRNRNAYFIEEVIHMRSENVCGEDANI